MGFFVVGCTQEMQCVHGEGCRGIPTQRPSGKSQLVSLISILEEVPNPRVKATVDHDLPDILTLALCTILCGGDRFYDMGKFGQVRQDWLRTFLRQTQGTPL